MPKYKAVYKHYNIISPDPDYIPPRVDYSKERGRSIIEHIFVSDNDKIAIESAKKYAREFFEAKKKSLPRGVKKLANKPSLEKLLEIIPPRKINF